MAPRLLIRRSGDFGTSRKQPSVEQIWMTVGGRYFVGGVNAMTNEGSRLRGAEPSNSELKDPWTRKIKKEDQSCLSPRPQDGAGGHRLQAVGFDLPLRSHQ